ncbi:uncharacterized protein BDW70DRAFT_142172 [Aspergillus foveolatus]|uniref:uncharacterized protein n=1 Tax=Aspergillus foveolatus TaxID=210207 RepID=UPI003CCDFED7
MWPVCCTTSLSLLGLESQVLLILQLPCRCHSSTPTCTIDRRHDLMHIATHIAGAPANKPQRNPIRIQWSRLAVSHAPAREVCHSRASTHVLFQISAANDCPQYPNSRITDVKRSFRYSRGSGIEGC